MLFLLLEIELNLPGSGDFVIHQKILTKKLLKDRRDEGMYQIKRRLLLNMLNKDRNKFYQSSIISLLPGLLLVL